MNKIINAIYNAPCEIYINTPQLIMISIFYRGQYYVGTAICHKEDAAFRSEIVGCTIAHMRAIKSAITAQRDEAYNEYKILNRAYKNLRHEHPNVDFDPCGLMRKRVETAKKYYDRYENAVVVINKTIKDYLASQDRAISSLKAQRKDKND